MTNDIKKTKELIGFIENSPTAFHATESIAIILREKGYRCLGEGEKWDIKPGGKYYVTRNMSSIISFHIPENYSESFMVTASHTDSPTYKLKNTAEIGAFDKYIKLDVEGYGGMIVSTWLDRPLSLAGRVIIKNENRIEAKLLKIDRDLVLIPNVAIHQMRNGYNYNAAVDMLPLFSSSKSGVTLGKIYANELGCSEDDIISADMYLYCRTPASVWGAEEEFFSSPRIDNLGCAFTTLSGFTDAVESGKCKAIAVYSSFDNEEVGSSTKQGAGSEFLHSVLERIADSLAFSYLPSLASSFMVSADNGHAIHPNHPELSDTKNAPHLNEGIVIKSNSAQKYTTDSISAALFAEICKNANVPVQYFANRSDLPGGSTLGSISNTKVAINTVDIGLAQLAMHSSYETAGVYDTDYMIKAIEEFYSSYIKCEKDGAYILG